MYRIRKCDKESDCDNLYRLVRELAEFEKGLDSFEMTSENYRNDGFRTSPPLFHAAFAEFNQSTTSTEENWVPVGYATWFFSYSTWKGRCVYLEDLYVQPPHRQKGLGKKLYSHCVKQALDAGCKAFDYIVLKWNTPAKQMYKSFGVTPRDDDGWHLMRMDKQSMDNFMTSHYVE